MMDLGGSSVRDGKVSGDGSSSNSRLRRLFLLATLLPAAIVFVDELAILQGNAQHWDHQSLTVLYYLYVFQVGLLAGVVGRFIDTWLLRWTILIWVLVLIDLRLFTLSSQRETGCLMYALFSGQLGLLVFVATLAPGPWPWRLPFSLVAAAVLVFFGMGTELWNAAWSLVLVMQTLAVFALCLLFLVCGFRLRQPEAGADVPVDMVQGHGFHFSIGHILFWMLAAVPVLALVQGIDLQFIKGVDVTTWVRLGYLGSCLSFVPLLVFGTLFFRTRTVALIPLSLLILAGMGVLLAATVTEKAWMTPGAVRWSWEYWFLAELREIGLWWIPWMLLSAGFLGGLLLVFRVSGYQFERRGRRGEFSNSSGAAADQDHKPGGTVQLGSSRRF
jgi:hypothetical protein